MSISTCGGDIWLLGDFLAESGNDFADESSEAKTGADLHRFFGGASNGFFGESVVDLREKGSFVGEIVSESAVSWCDDSAKIIT